MVYGAGGGNLDPALILNLRQALGAGVNDNVKFTAQINFSKALQTWDDDLEDIGLKGVKLQGTQRLWLEPGNTSEFKALQVAEGGVVPMYTAKTLADYITWAKGKFPSKHYILIFWGHGSGYSPGYDTVKESVLPVSQAVVFDDNFEMNGISIWDSVEGIRRSGTYIETVYYDACIMNTLENLSELRGNVHYSLGAGHTTPGIGGDYGSLLKILGRGGGTEEALSEYCYQTMAHWNILGSRNDITLTDLTKLDGVLEAVKNIAGELVASYEEGRLFFEDDGTPQVYPYKIFYNNIPPKTTLGDGGVYFYEFNPENLIEEDLPGPFPTGGSAIEEGYIIPDGSTGTIYDAPNADIYQYAQYLAVRSNNPRLFAYSADLLSALGDAIVYGEESESVPAITTFSVTLMHKNSLGTGGYSDANYGKLAFNEATGWFNWLKKNETYVVGNIQEEE
jgi:hypothetical protein